MKPLPLLLFTLASFTAALACLAQDATFNAQTREVVVPVAVSDKGGKPIDGLQADDFLILNDGKPQIAKLIERDSSALPVHAVLVLQTGGTSAPVLAKLKKVASVVSTYITNDMEIGAPSLAAVVTVADGVQMTQDFTPDGRTLHNVLTHLQAAGDSGRLLDGVDLAIDLLAGQKEAARRAIVLISESRDRGSQAHFAAIAAKAQRRDVAIYTLSYSAYATAFTQKAADVKTSDMPGLYDPGANSGASLLTIGAELARLAKVNIADALARSTGGAHDHFTTLAGLETQLIAIGHEIHNRYTLTFVPPEMQAGGFHELAVKVTRPGNWRVHARAGYWSGVQ